VQVDRRAVESRNSRCSILGFSTFVGTVREAAELVAARADSGNGGYACLGNVHVLVTARQNDTVAEALHRAWIVFPDGAPIAWLQRLLGAGRAERVGGPDLMPLVFDLGRAAGLRHFLLGSTPDVLDHLRRRLLARFPGVEIVGALSPPFGPFDESDQRELIRAVRASRPDVVWCALGAPKQELWMRESADHLSPAVLVGVGAAFDFHAGARPRAPRWMQRSGMEWLFRLASEPRRLAGRYARTNTRFLLLAAQSLIRDRRDRLKS
jgi:N-acetylglucosaminyldiphosphoundecaprenol N-acetyl-beta-D-mannosaminyltransferase